jgi:endoglucanase
MNHTNRFLLSLLALLSLVSAQLALPKPPFLPPNISSGAQSSSGAYPNQKWSSLLGTLLYFYDEQRSGTLPSTNRVPWRNNSLVYEGRDVEIDLTGIPFLLSKQCDVKCY